MSDLVALWVARAAWAALALFAAPGFAAALDERSRAVQLVASIGLWSGWAIGLLALLVPSAVSLTAARLIVPVAPLASVTAGLAGGPSATEVAIGVAVGVLAMAAAMSAEFGRCFAQASAYGDETRFPLRPPSALLAGPIPLIWAVAAASAIAGPLLLAARSWIFGGPLTAFAAWFTWLVARRLHRLSRRWLVFVPAGVVVHDHVVLAETSMFVTAAVRGCGLAEAGTEAADLTGAALGTALEFRLATGGDKVIFAPDRQRPNGSAIHVRSFLVSPSRPGRALAEARRRGIGPG